MMSQCGEEIIPEREKLKILRSMIPDLQRYLVPSKIISDMIHFLGEPKSEEILEKEQTSRTDAVKLLIDAVLEQKETGLNHFIYAMELCEGAGWEQRFLNPLQNHEVGEMEAGNASANRYFHFILKCLQGEIIRTLTKGELDEILIWLRGQSVIDEVDMEEIQDKPSVFKRALHLFSLMPRNASDWPLKFFIAIQDVKPNLLRKIDPCHESPLVQKEEDQSRSETKKSRYRDGTSQRASDEETVPKRPRLSDDEDMDEDTLLAGSDTDDSDADVLTQLSDLDLSDDGEKPDDDTEKGNKPDVVKMYHFQHELAAPSLAGINNIVCAPTGSGKTVVALYIVQEHLKRQIDCKKRKVVFLANKVPLVQQQFKIFEKFLSHDFKCVLASGETGNRDNLHMILDDYDILVMTPKILENNLAPDKIPSLAAFSLIILDECHNTRKGEPYNALMKRYLESKSKGETGLPQIVGLTASIGVEKATTLPKAIESIISLMSNLDVKEITTVETHKDELEQLIPKPAERMEELTPRTNDIIRTSILANMETIERMIGKEFKASEGLGDPEIAALFPLFKSCPSAAQRQMQKYGQWATRMCRKASSLFIPKDREQDEVIKRRLQFTKNVRRLSESLVVYNEALDVHELTRPVDVLDYIKRLVEPRYAPSPLHIDQPAPQQGSPVETEICRLVQELQVKTKKISSSTANPNLNKLADTIIDTLDEKGWDNSRVMVFVRTRATCKALCSWLNSDNVDSRLKKMKAAPFTGTAAPQDKDGMTQPEQESIVDKFRSGEIRLLVCTTIGQEGIDIPDCNLVIRYNHVGNEVATVQTRGRSRKLGGLSVLLAMPQIIRKEKVNKRLVEMMAKAIEEVRKMRNHDISNAVQKTQTKTMEEEERKRVASEQKKKSRKKEPTFSLECARCRKVKVDGACIRTIQGSHHIIIGWDLVKHGDVEVKYMKKPKNIDDFQLTGEIVCRQEQSAKPTLLGHTMRSLEVEYLALKAESWVVLNNKGVVEKSGKWKWGDLGYNIPERTSDDIRQQLSQQMGEEAGACGGGDI